MKASFPVLAAASLTLLTAACGTVERTGAPGYTAAPAASADAVVLRVERFGGFVPPERLATELPTISVYGDGRVITQGPQPAIYPGPAMPNVQVQRIDVAALGKLVTRATDAGVGSVTDLGTPGVADAPTTRFTVLTPGGAKNLEVAALDESLPDDPALTAAQKAARAKLRALNEALTDLPGLLGAGSVGGSEPYVPTALAAVASPWTPGGDVNLPDPPERAWPGPKLPGEPLRDPNLGCVTATGPEVATIVEAGGSANARTPWGSDGKRWSVVLRPLLPDEASCASLVP